MNARITTAGSVIACIVAFVIGPAFAAIAETAAELAQKNAAIRAKMAAVVEAVLEKEGGSRILFKVDGDALHEVMMTELRDNVVQILREERIPFTGLAMNQSGVELRIADPKNRQALVTKLASAAEAAPSRGAAVDVAQGSDGLINLTPAASGVAVRLNELVVDSGYMVKQGLRDVGIKPAAVEPDGTDRFRVLLPGVSDPQKIAAMLTRTTRVAFRLVDPSMSAADALTNGSPSGSEVLDDFRSDKKPYLLRKEVAVDGDDLVDVMPGLDSQNHDQPIVSFRFNARGARRFAHVTADNIGQAFAIVVDERVVSASVIREPITGGSGQIAGNFTLDEASTIAMRLRSGTPTGRLSVVDTQIVQPSAGVAAK